MLLLLVAAGPPVPAAAAALAVPAAVLQLHLLLCNNKVPGGRNVPSEILLESHSLTSSLTSIV